MYGQMHVPSVKLGIPMAAATVVEDRHMVCVNASGLAVPAADTAGLVFAGHAEVGFDNTAGAAGTTGRRPERNVVVNLLAICSYDVSGATPVWGQRALVVDSKTVSADATTNNVDCGVFVGEDPLHPGKHYVAHQWAAR